MSSTFAFMMAAEPDGNVLPILEVVVNQRMSELEELMARIESRTEVHHLASMEHDALQSIENILSDAKR